jgi:serine/threonine protein phosphatase PrpC
MTALRVGSASDVGKVRVNNQDQLLVAAPLFAVADGMGGHAAGEVASLTAVEALKAAFGANPTAEGLAAAVREANRAVWEKAAHDPGLMGMGTTLVALALVNEDGEDRLAIVNVGDSRVYLLRQGELEQLTTDHSLVQELVDEGRLTEDEATVHPQRHVLTRALGADAEVSVDSIQVLPFKGDRFLLCSDGLPREVTDAQVASILRRFADPEEAAKELVAEARAHGGNDNITVVVVDVVDDDDKAAAASAALADEPGLVIPSDLGKSATPEADDGAGGGGRRGRRRARQEPAVTAPKSRAITLRVVGFLLLLVALLGGAVAATGWYARGAYYVAVDGSAITIYKGRPGGLLWFRPTVAQRTGVPTNAVLASRLDDLKRGKEETSIADARQYVRNLQDEARAHSSTTTAATVTVPSSVP